MKILILEDEIYNFHLLRHMLEDMDEDHNVIGPITSIKYGIDYFQMHPDVDIIIADIRLNDGLSFDALKYAPSDVPVIFTTAYDQHALQAFEYNSLSYLLKPIDEDELRIAMDKAKQLRLSTLLAKQQQETEGMGDVSERILQDTDSGKAQDPYRHRFLVKTAQGERVILLDSIRYIVSEDRTTYIKLLDKGSYAIDLTLDTLSEQLDPQYFMRVNRKYIIPLVSITATKSLPNGRMLLILRGDNSPEIIISRDKRHQVIAWLEKG